MWVTSLSVWHVCNILFTASSWGETKGLEYFGNCTKYEREHQIYTPHINNPDPKPRAPTNAPGQFDTSSPCPYPKVLNLVGWSLYLEIRKNLKSQEFCQIIFYKKFIQICLQMILIYIGNFSLASSGKPGKIGENRNKNSVITLLSPNPCPDRTPAKAPPYSQPWNRS